MAKISKYLRTALDTKEGRRYLHFKCPGCMKMHTIKVNDFRNDGWDWNSNPDKPTFKPSILVTGFELTEDGKKQLDEFRANGCKSVNGRTVFDRKPSVCHSFVTDGRIQFLGDSTHALAGTTVDMVEVED